MSVKTKVLIYGTIGSLFFSLTFILNRSMALGGGNFIWSASLRYLFSLPLLFILVRLKGSTKKINKTIGKNFSEWIIWSNIGFVLFYLGLTFASNYGSSWLVAATWQITIVAGTLLTPLFNQKIPKSSLLCCLLILFGVFILQIDNLITFKLNDVLWCILPVTIAAISYPLGNRKIMFISGGELSTLERIYAMTLCTTPTWIIISLIQYMNSGYPSINQTIQALIVTIFSAIIATLLFFHATDIARHSPSLLSLAESTISLEVIFTLIGGIVFLNDAFPTLYGWIGILIIILGMILISKKK